MEFISKINACLTRLISFEKAGAPIEDVLRVLTALLKEGVPLCTSEERIACRSIVLTGLRVAANETIERGRWKKEREGYAAVVEAVLADNVDMGGSLQWSHLRVLLSCLLSDISGEVRIRRRLISAVQRMIFFILGTESTRREMFSPSSLPVFAKLVSCCLEISCDFSLEKELRLMALDLLFTSCTHEESVLSFSLVLPGMLSQLATSITDGGSQHPTVIQKSIQVFCSSVCRCLSDASLSASVENISDCPPSIQALIPTRDEEWIMKCTERTKEFLVSLCSTCSIHRDWEVRLCLLTSIDSVHSECKKAFDNVLDDVIMDLLLLLGGDQYQKISSKVDGICARLRASDPSMFSIHLHDRLNGIAEKFPLDVRKGTQIKAAQQQLVGVLHLLSSDLPFLFTSRSPTVVSLVCSLMSSIRIDTKRLMISRNESVNTVASLMSNIPLLYDLDVNMIADICTHLAVGSAEVLDVLLNELSDSSISDRLGGLVILTLICPLLPSTEADSYLFQAAAEAAIEALQNVNVQPAVVDRRIEDTSRAHSQESMLAVLWLSSLAVSMKRIEEERVKLRLLMSCLYRLLELCATPIWNVQEAGQVALIEIAESFGQSVSEVLLSNAAYIISRVSLDSRSMEDHRKAPVVLSVLLDRVESDGLFPYVKPIVTELLGALDRYKQEWTIQILRSMLSFVRAINRWYPTLEPIEPEVDSSNLKEEEEDIPENENIESINDPVPTVDIEKVPHPEAVVMVEAVLNRTRHLLTSPHFPVRLVVLDIVKEGLWVIRKFDNALLPMIHQNWLSLIHLFVDKEYGVRAHAIEVVRVMVEVSNTFVYKKVKDQLWPLLLSWAKKEVHKKPVFTQSSSFKYQVVLLESVAPIWIGIEMTTEDDKETVMSFLAEFQKPGIHSRLRQLSLEAALKVEEYLASKTTV